MTDTKQMYRIPVTLNKEIDQYGTLIEEYLAGKIEPVKFKAIRVPMGIYEQRKDNTYMVRIRCAAGYISPGQLKKVARIGMEHNASHVHITTRQELQIHNVSLDKTLLVLQDLYKAGLASRGGGGNTVRNVMASVDAGVSKDELFDVTPYAVALTNKLIAEPDSWTLPRKYKISFSGSDQDNAYAAFNDLGFIARIQKGMRGFKVFIGGSFGDKAMKGHVLFDFVPAEEIFIIADAVKKLFSRYGNRRNRHKARLRFIFYKLGKDKVFELFFKIYEEIKRAQNLLYEIENPEFISPIYKLKPEVIRSDDFNAWKKRYVEDQKQDNLKSIVIPFEHGDIDCERLFKIGDFFSQFGDDVIRFSMRQNIRARNIPEQYLGNVYNFLNEINVLIHDPFLLNSLVSCTGADTCRLGICMSKGLVSSIRKELEKVHFQLDNLNNLNINISGCPNSCGQHKAADLGFYGKVGRNSRMYPAYKIVAGAVTGGENSRLAETVDEISARDIPRFTVELLEIYNACKDKYESFAEYMKDRGKLDIKKLCDKVRNVPDWDEDKNYYFDWTSDQVFSLVGRGIGECSAGIYDMIDVDMNAIKSYKEEIKKLKDIPVVNKLLYNIIFSASRMLLVTRGVEPKNTYEVFDSFIKKFIDAKLIGNEYRGLVEAARNNTNFNFLDVKDKIFEMAGAVIELYNNMDDSLQFAIPEDTESKDVSKAGPVYFPALKKDYRGVLCPMNFVKTKMDLASIKSGEILEILLDDGEPIENVPGSVKSEGHRILEQNKIDDYWSVKIEKK
ncbi:MAG: sulfite reductase subunit beta (hemoprotein) [Chlorobi bacterium]|nr:sulfite reductase subunit beta (hemoprotein) [Chlorobiota bacterium]